MIRHTKSQRIAGSAALALSDLSSETVVLEMTTQERNSYNICVRKKSEPANLSMKVFGLEMALHHRREACFTKSKVNALVKDLNALRLVEPDMHCVVLTHFQKGFALITAELRRLGYTVYGACSGIQATKRHKAIEEFQMSVNRAQTLPDMQRNPAKSNAKVFVAMMKIGNVGITLTAATRVYLLEPCLDPMMEIQAAGRIHRLGQTRPVLVKKFVHRDTVDSFIENLHSAMKSGNVSVVDGVFLSNAIHILFSK